jgi:TetR/AcrR family transcriptional regulator
MDSALESTQSRILNVATSIFQQKGLAGARMQEIADIAGINKAMLHYYFKTKEDLFGQVFERAFVLFVGKINQILSSELALKDKVGYYVDHTVDTLCSNPVIPAFVLHEINRDPQRITAMFAGDSRIDLTVFKNQFKSESKANRFFTDMVSLCVYPFVAQPMLEKMLGMNGQEYNQFMQHRKEFVKDILFGQL